MDMKKNHIILIAVLVIVAVLCLVLGLRSCSSRDAATEETPGGDVPVTSADEPGPADSSEPAGGTETEMSGETGASEEPEDAEDPAAAQNGGATLTVSGPGGIPEPGSYAADPTDDEGEADGPMEIQDEYVVILGENETHDGG